MAFSLKFWNKKIPNEQVREARRSVGYSGGTIVDEDSAMQVSAFHRGVIYISTQISKLPWDVKDKDNNIIKGKVSYLLNVSPNGEMTSFNLKNSLLQQAITHGNAYCEIERDLVGTPIALWPIPTKQVQVLRNPLGGLVYRVMGGSLQGGDVMLPPRDIFHIRNFHTKDGIVGQGIVAYGMNILGIGLGADRFANNLYSNGGLPSGTLEVPGALSDEAFKRIKDAWDANHKGKKTGGIAILEEGIKFTPVSLDPQVMQFLESRKFNVLEISRFLGIPPTKLFDMEGAKFANMENANLEVATDCLDAWAKNLELEADMKLLNGQYGDKRTEIDLYEVFRGDMKSRAEYFSKMMQSAAMTPNEIRRKEGMPPVTDGNRTFLAINNYSPMDRVDEIIDSQINKGQTLQQTPAQKDVTPQPQVKNELDELELEALKYLQRK